MTELGKVYLVGAGPGDPGMLTLRGAQCLQQADVILYDYLVNPLILSHARPDAQRILLGRDSSMRSRPQEQVSWQLAEWAARGLTVVRLKGGDPIVFARIAEETEMLAARGIPFELVPGVTAALAAASCAGIPLTHRELASAVALVAGQEQSGKSARPLDYAALASFPGTLVFYMGAKTVGSWAPALMAAGKPADTPAAIVRRCSFPDQTSVRCTLGELSREPTLQEVLKPPVVIVVGEVAAACPHLAWFERRPLFGVTVLVTRPQRQADKLVQPLAELGARVLVQPAIEIGDPPSWAPLDDALGRLREVDWLVFSSANGVRYLLRRLWSLGRDLRDLAPVRLAAIGPGTTAELAQFHLRADLQAEQFQAEGLAAALASQGPGKRFLLVRASRGREVLAEQLTAAGGRVEQVVVYASTDVADADRQILQQLSDGAVDWVTVTSSAIARSLAVMFGQHLRQARLASISPITSATLRELGYEPAAEASVYTMAGVIAAIQQAVTAGK